MSFIEYFFRSGVQQVIRNRYVGKRLPPKRWKCFLQGSTKHNYWLNILPSFLKESRVALLSPLRPLLQALPLIGNTFKLFSIFSPSKRTGNYKLYWLCLIRAQPVHGAKVLWYFFYLSLRHALLWLKCVSNHIHFRHLLLSLKTFV